MGGVEDERRLVVRDYFHEDDRLAPRGGHGRRWPTSTPTTCSTSRRWPRSLHLPEGGRRPRRRRCSPAATGCWPGSPGCPSRSSTASSTRFGNLQKIMRATIDDLDDVEGVGEHRARAIKEGLVPAGRVEHPRPLQLRSLDLPRSAPLDRAEDPRAHRLPSGTPAELARPGPIGDADRGLVRAAPTSWGCGRCSTTWSPGLAAENGWAVVRARALPRPARTCTLERALRRPVSATLDDAAVRGRRWCAAADATGCDAGRRPRLLHGRHVRPQGGGHRPLPPGGVVLRDDPGARDVAQPDAWPTPSTALPSPRSAARCSAIVGTVDPYVPDADVADARGRRGRRSCATRAPTTASCTTRRARPTGADDAADAWRRAIEFLAG